MDTATTKRQQTRATYLYRRAVERGELVRAAECERCGHKARTHGHHWHGYAEEFALDVQWLCQPCHNRVHSAVVGGRLGGLAFVAKVPIELRSEIGRKGGRASVARRSAEERIEFARSGGNAFVEKSTPEQRAERGRKGGITTMSRLTKEERSELGRRAVQARWERHRAAS